MNVMTHGALIVFDIPREYQLMNSESINQPHPESSAMPGK